MIAVARAPKVRVLDARVVGVDERGLRDWARRESTCSPVEHVARSYCYPYAIVAAHSDPVGVDIERVHAVDREFGESICTPAETRELPRTEDLDGFFTSLWCSKEALAKALGDARQYDPRRLESPGFWTDGGAGPWRAAEVPAPPGHVAWLCWRDARGQR